MRVNRRSTWPTWILGMVTGALALTVAPMAHAQISFVDLFRSNTFIQTGNGNTLTPNGSFFASRLFSVNAGDFNTVTMTYPGPGSPVGLAQTDSKTFEFSSPTLPTQALMDVAFPPGTYAFSATGTSMSGSTSVNYTSDFYPQSLPYLAGTNYSDLQGMNSAATFGIQYSPFQTGSGVSSSFIFFTIFDRTTNMLVFDAGFQPPTTTALTLPANALVPGHDYTYEVIFSNRVSIDTTSTQFPSQLGFDLRTTGAFTTAVPEPAALTMLAAGGVVLVLRGGRCARGVK